MIVTDFAVQTAQSVRVRKGRNFMDFKHPLARGAKVWEAKLRTGETKKILIIVTNAELDAGKKKYSVENVERLVIAAEEFLSDNHDVDGYALANRLRDWESSKDR